MDCLNYKWSKNLKKIVIKKFSIAFLIASMLLTPVINMSGPLFLKSLDVYANLFFIMYLCIRTKGLHFKCNIILAPIFLVWLVLFVHIGLLELIYRSGDTTGFSILLRSLVTFMAGIGCATFLIDKFADNAMRVFIKVVIFCAIIQGMVLWLTFLNHDFRDFMSYFFYRDLSSTSAHLFELRTPGFVPNGGDGLSMNHALLCIVGLMGIYMFYSGKMYAKLMVLFVLVSMLATTFAGRTGLYLGVLFSLLIFATYKSNFRITPNIHKILFFSLLVFFTVFLFKDELGVYGKNMLDEYGYEYPLVRLLRGFIDLQQYGQYGDSTINKLLTDMVVFPSEPVRFFLGNNDFGQATSFLINSDVGYFRLWHGIGLVGLILFFSGFYIAPIILINQKIRSKILKIRKKNGFCVGFSADYRPLLIFVLLFGLIGNYKIIYISSRIYLFVFIVVLLLVDYQYRIGCEDRLKRLSKGNVCAD